MTEAEKEFLDGYDFMRLGQSINHENWSGAGMAAQRMQAKAAAAGMDDFVRLLRNLKMAIGHKEKKVALDLLAQITAKRVHMLNSMKQLNSIKQLNQDTQD
jgi:hypothetical protein